MPDAAEVYDQHLLGTLQVRTLQSVTDAALDEAGEGLNDWKLLEPSCTLRGLPRLMQTLQVGVGVDLFISSSLVALGMRHCWYDTLSPQDEAGTIM